MNKNRYSESIRLKVIVSYTLLFLISVFSIWFVYSKIKEITTPKIDISDSYKKLYMISSALTKIYEAESISRTYSQTASRRYFSNYIEKLEKIGVELDSLKELCSDNPDQVIKVDSIFLLYKQNSEIVKELAYLRNIHNTDQLIEEAISKIETKSDSVPIADEGEVKRTVTITRDSVYIPLEYRGEEGFFEKLKNLFGKKNTIDSTLIVSVSESVKVDSIRKLKESSDSLARVLKDILLDFKEGEALMSFHLSRKEKKLLIKNRFITMRIREMLSLFEKEEIENSIFRFEESREVIHKTTTMVALAGAAALFLILVFSFMIYKDISRSVRYKKQLEDAKNYAESLLKARERFLANVSHEIRSPLSSIIGFADLLQKSSMSENQKEYLQSIKGSSDHMLKLVNDILDFSKLEAGKLQFENMSFNLKELIEETHRGFIPATELKRLAFPCLVDERLDTYCFSDPFRIKQVLINLIGNAVKFTEKGEVSVKADVINETGTKIHCKIEVTDTGIGIPEEQQSLIFTEFTQAATNISRIYGGTGLGLTISRKIVELFDGALSLTSELGKGSTFSLVIPLIRYTGHSSVISKEVNISMEKLRDKSALIIDDDKTILLLIKEMLQHTGMDTDIVNTGELAMKKIKEKTYDVVFLDYQLGDTNGFELAHNIRKIAHYEKHKLPLVIVSANVKLYEQKILKENGINYFIAKPFTEKDILQILFKIFYPTDWLKLSMHKSPPAKSTKHAVPEKEMLNLDSIKGFAQNDHMAVKMILQSFFTNTKESVHLLRQYSDTKNMKDLSLIAHRISSLFKQFGVDQVKKELYTLELLSDQPVSATEIKNCVRKVIVTSDEVLVRLKEKLSEL